jgi:hypothetical protein
MRNDATEHKGLVMELTEEQIKQCHEARLIHGGEGAISRIQDGKPLLGPARDYEMAVYDRLREDGVEVGDLKGLALIRCRNAARGQGALDCLWDGLQAATQAQDEEAFDRVIRRWGWYIGKVRAEWDGFAEMMESKTDGLVIDAIRAAQEARDGDGHHKAD